MGVYDGYLLSGVLEEAQECLLTGRVVYYSWAGSGLWVTFPGSSWAVFVGTG